MDNVVASMPTAIKHVQQWRLDTGPRFCNNGMISKNPQCPPHPPVLLLKETLAAPMVEDAASAPPVLHSVFDSFL